MELFVLVMITEVSYSGDEKEVVGVYSSEEKANLAIENIRKNNLNKFGNLGYVDKLNGEFVTFSIEKCKLDDM